jgi:hypothetical protein
MVHKYVQAERMFCAKIYNMQPNTNMRSNSRYKCSVSWQVLKSILKYWETKFTTSASSFIAAHTDRHCTMDHDQSCFSSMATYRCKRLFQTTDQNCTLCISKVQWGTYTRIQIFIVMGILYSFSKGWSHVHPSYDMKSDLPSWEGSGLVTTSTGCSFPSLPLITFPDMLPG